MNDSKKWEFDALEERLLDMYFDEEDDFVNIKFSDLMESVDDVIKEMMSEDGNDAELSMLTEEAKKILKSQKNEKTNKFYERYIKMFMTHCTELKLDPWCDPLVINLMLHVSKKFSKGTLWSIFLCLNNGF